MAKVGDTVRFLNTAGGGIIVRIEGQVAHVEDSDGFEIPILLRECVVVNTDISKKSFFDHPADLKTVSKATVTEVALELKPTTEQNVVPEALPLEETPDGDSMNVVIAFAPVNHKELSTSRFEVYLVNDSNYYLNFSILTKGDNRWNLLASDTLEPNIQLRVCEFTHDRLPEMQHLAFQAFAFKRDKSFEIKNPINYRHKFDGTKFYKLHAFKESDYFDTPVLEIPIVINDIPQRQIEIDPVKLQQSITIKADDAPQRTQHIQSKKAQKHERRVEVVDLHIHELLDNLTGLTNADMLSVQLAEFNKVMEANRNHHNMRIVFIHGKGEGVLRKAITDQLKRKYPRCQWHDASFKEYGFGATEVVIH